MPSGALSLLEATKSATDMKKKGVVQTIIQESPFIEMIPWLPFAGNAYKQTIEDTLPRAQFRAVNGTYSRYVGTDTERFWGVSILGGEYAVDNFLVNVTGTEDDLEAKQIVKLSKANAMRFDYEAINGTGASNGFKGLKQLLSEGLGQTLVNAANGGTLSLDKLDEANDLLLNTGSADAMLTNRTIRRKITSKARSSVTGISLIDVGTDVFGRQVTKWNDIPIRTLGQVMDGSDNFALAFPFTEDPGDATADCSSIWFLKFGEDNVCGLLGKGGSFDVKRFGEQQAAPARMGRLEWYPGLAVFDQYAVVRLSSIDQT